MHRTRRGPGRAAAGAALLALAAPLATSLDAQRPVPAPRRPATVSRPAAPPPPATASTPKTESSAARGRYRVLLSGFHIRSETYDDPLQLDGKRDEVYISVGVMETDRHGKALLPGGTAKVESSVLGDVGGAFGGSGGHNGRVRAGSASSNGGLRTGDSYPTREPWRVEPASRKGARRADLLPMELWSGELVRGENVVLLTPTIWEYDAPDLREAYRGWQQWLGSAATRLGDDQTFTSLVTASFPEAPLVLSLGQLGPSLVVSGMDALGRMGNRPIGMQLRTTGGTEELSFEPKTVVLNYDNVERILSGSTIGGKPGAVMVDYVESHPKLGGNYHLYLVVERVP
ncbi:MAG TPA: hypothetical protein VFZ11_01665 [Gemmatimonadaceae bacterium]